MDIKTERLSGRCFFSNGDAVLKEFACGPCTDGARHCGGGFFTSACWFVRCQMGTWRISAGEKTRTPRRGHRRQHVEQWGLFVGVVVSLTHRGISMPHSFDSRYQNLSLQFLLHSLYLTLDYFLNCWESYLHDNTLMTFVRLDYATAEWRFSSFWLSVLSKLSLYTVGWIQDAHLRGSCEKTCNLFF